MNTNCNKLTVLSIDEMSETKEVLIKAAKWTTSFGSPLNSSTVNATFAPFVITEKEKSSNSTAFSDARVSGDLKTSSIELYWVFVNKYLSDSVLKTS